MAPRVSVTYDTPFSYVREDGGRFNKHLAGYQHLVPLFLLHSIAQWCLWYLQFLFCNLPWLNVTHGRPQSSTQTLPWRPETTWDHPGNSRHAYALSATWWVSRHRQNRLLVSHWIIWNSPMCDVLPVSPCSESSSSAQFPAHQCPRTQVRASNLGWNVE